jgi:hypothetical protein
LLGTTGFLTTEPLGATALLPAESLTTADEGLSALEAEEATTAGGAPFLRETEDLLGTEAFLRRVVLRATAFLQEVAFLLGVEGTAEGLIVAEREQVQDKGPLDLGAVSGETTGSWIATFLRGDRVFSWEDLREERRGGRQEGGAGVEGAEIRVSCLSSSLLT